MKKIYILFILLCFLLVGCNDQKLEPPTNLNISNDILSYCSESDYTSYRIICIGPTTQKRVVEGQQVQLDDLNLPVGKYKIYVQGLLNDIESNKSIDFVEYEVEEKMVKSISGMDMVNNQYIKWNGRTILDNNECMLYNCLSGFEVEIMGTYLEISMTSTNYNISYKAPYISIVIDDNFDDCQVYCLNKAVNDIKINVSQESSKHNIKLYKRSEAIDSFIGVKSLKTDGSFLNRVSDKKYLMEVIGDSTIAGYGNETYLENGVFTNKTSSNSNSLKTFAFLASLQCDCDISVLCASGWGLTGSIWTTPETLNLYESYEYADPLKKNYYMPSRKSDIVIISLGTNDLYYIEKEQSELRKTNFINQYKNLIKKIRLNSPNSKIIMIYGVMNETRMYGTINDAYNQIKKTYSDVYLLKLQGDDGAIDHHPSKASHISMSNDLIVLVKRLLNIE